MLVMVLALAGSALLAQQRQVAAPEDQDSAYTPPPPWKSVEIGDFYFHKKDYRGALSRYQEATHTDPDYAPAYRGLGKAYEKLGRKSLALKAYERYLDALPSAQQAAEAKDAHQAIARLKAELATANKPNKSRP
jgi:tetratricopeptide (TPR) repeat protein